jgi:pimeloyl-ACP methyl ester carboxylesterase
MTEEVAKGMSVEPMLRQYTNMSDSDFRVMQKQVIRSMMANQEKQEEVVSWSVASDRRAMAYTMNELMTNDLRDDIAAIKVAVLVLGAWQPTYPFSKEQQKAVYAQQYKAIPNVRLAMADDARHFIMFDSPEWYMKQIGEFMQ